MTAVRNPNLDTEPITKLDQSPPSKVGRPRLHPPMPLLDLNPEERILFDGYMADWLDAYPDLTSSDYRLLWLSGIKYLQFLRLLKKEVETGNLLSMARTHPAVEMRALLDQVSVTRRARTKEQITNDPNADELRAALLSLGQRVRRS